MNLTLVLFLALLAALAQITTILKWLKIEPEHVFSREWWKMNPVSISKGKLILVLVLGVFSLAFSSYGVYQIAHIPKPIPAVTGARIVSQTAISSLNPQLPFGLEVEIRTDEEYVAPAQLFIVCDGDIGEAHGVRLQKGGDLQAVNETILISPYPTHPDVFNLKWRAPLWKPDDPLIVRFFSKTKIQAKYAAPIIYRPNTP